MDLIQELKAEAALVQRAAALDHCLTPVEAAGTARVLRKAARFLTTLAQDEKRAIETRTSKLKTPQ